MQPAISLIRKGCDEAAHWSMVGQAVTLPFTFVAATDDKQTVQSSPQSSSATLSRVGEVRRPLVLRMDGRVSQFVT